MEEGFWLGLGGEGVKVTGILVVGVDDEGWGCLCWGSLIQLKTGIAI